jgi:hypothetical protein
MTSLLGAILGAFVGGMMPDERIEMLRPRVEDVGKLRSLARYSKNEPPLLCRLYELIDCDSVSK